MPRKAADQRSQERADAERRCWDQFRPKLEALQTFDDAVRLVGQAPPPDAPGRRYYSNLGFFLNGFAVPAGSGYTERALYLQLVQRIDAAGGLKPGALEPIERVIKASLRSE